MQNKIRPPFLAELILKLFLPKSDAEFLLGDYNDIYETQYKEYGRLYAAYWYWHQTIITTPGYILNSFYWGIIMLKNYFTVALRYLLNQKVYTLLNIAGISIAMACSLLIFMWVQNEFSYDNFIEDSDSIYRVVQQIDHAGMKNKIARSQIPLAPELKSNYPEVSLASRFFQFDQNFEIEKQKINELGAYADQDFIEIFSPQFISGKAESSLLNPHSIIISNTLSNKLFGTQNALGKSIKLDSETDVTVTGVFEDYPENSHLKFEFLIPFEILYTWGVPRDAWKSVNNPIYTYIKTNGSVDINLFSSKIEMLVNQKTEQTNTKLSLQPLNSIYLYSDYRGDYAGLGNINYIYISIIMGIFILGIACFNFINLSSSKIIGRTKEFGVRKVIGANKSNLITQHLVETYIIIFSSTLISCLLVFIVLPNFNSLLEKNLSLNFSENLPLLMLSFSFPVLLGLLSGLYPAVLLSSFSPSSILRGKNNTRLTGSGMKKTIVIVQFTLAISICIGMIITYKQFSYIQNKWLGFEKEALLWFEVSEEMQKNFDVFSDEIRKEPSIQSAALSSHLLTDVTHIMGSIDWQGKDPNANFEVNCLLVDENFIPTMQMQLKDGRNFSKDFASDKESAVILNESAVKMMNLQDPINAKIGYHSNNLNVVGIVKDFHFKPLQSSIEPMVLVYSEEEELYMYVRITPENMKETLEKIGSIWNKVFPSTIYDPKFLDKEIAQMYSNEEKVQKLFFVFTVISIFISCMGLFGLASYIAERKTKEIGIRKTVGASSLEIVILLTKQFVFWVITSNIIAIPISYFVMQSWLDSFQYKTDIGIMVFILTGLITLTIAVLTVGYQTIKASRVNPVESLKYE